MLLALLPIRKGPVSSCRGIPVRKPLWVEKDGRFEVNDKRGGAVGSPQNIACRYVSVSDADAPEILHS